MNNSLQFTNCQVVTREKVFSGVVTVENGFITEINEGQAAAKSDSVDLNGDLLIPGLIEMHTDNLEKHLVPRPGVLWPSPLAALLAHDAQLASAGITTVLDAVCVGWFLDDMRPKLLDLSVNAVEQAKKKDILRSDHLLHMRCEVADPFVIEMFEQHMKNDLVKLVSFMDHTPGQRQWLNIDKYRLYHKNKNWSESELQGRINALKEHQANFAQEHKEKLGKLCAELDVPIASHDDTEESHVDEAYQDGAVISEFPTTLHAAKKARTLGMDVVGGAPNLVRGESHSGNVSVTELGEQRLLTGLSSDYVPVSLLNGIFKLHTAFHYSLPEAVAHASSNTARMLGLNDRGEIAQGKKADVVHVQIIDDLPVVRGVWRQGNRIA
jgi:alpha-D-ribose 1-methylphosphonate 5-triphosphate diphosphatase